MNSYNEMNILKLLSEYKEIDNNVNNNSNNVQIQYNNENVDKNIDEYIDESFSNLEEINFQKSLKENFTKKEINNESPKFKQKYQINFTNNDLNCNRCLERKVEILCNNCEPLNKFCTRCDSLIHSLNNAKFHKREKIDGINKNNHKLNQNQNSENSERRFFIPYRKKLENQFVENTLNEKDNSKEFQTKENSFIQNRNSEPKYLNSSAEFEKNNISRISNSQLDNLSTYQNQRSLNIKTSRSKEINNDICSTEYVKELKDIFTKEKNELQFKIKSLQGTIVKLKEQFSNFIKESSNKVQEYTVSEDKLKNEIKDLNSKLYDSEVNTSKNIENINILTQNNKELNFKYQQIKEKFKNLLLVHKEELLELKENFNIQIEKNRMELKNEFESEKEHFCSTIKKLNEDREKLKFELITKLNENEKIFDDINLDKKLIEKRLLDQQEENTKLVHEIKSMEKDILFISQESSKLKSELDKIKIDHKNKENSIKNEYEEQLLDMKKIIEKINTTIIKQEEDLTNKNVIIEEQMKSTEDIIKNLNKKYELIISDLKIQNEKDLNNFKIKLNESERMQNLYKLDIDSLKCEINLIKSENTKKNLAQEENNSKISTSTKLSNKSKIKLSKLECEDEELEMKLNQINQTNLDNKEQINTCKCDKNYNTNEMDNSLITEKSSVSKLNSKVINDSNKKLIQRFKICKFSISLISSRNIMEECIFILNKEYELKYRKFNQELNTIKDLFKTLIVKIQDMEKSHKEMIEEYNKNQEMLKNSEKLIKKLKKENDEFGDKFDDLRLEFNLILEENKNIKEDKNELESKLNIMQESNELIEKLIQENQAYNCMTIDQEKKIIDVTNENTKLRSRIKEFSNEINKLKENNFNDNNVYEEINNLKLKIEYLTKELDTIEKRKIMNKENVINLNIISKHINKSEKKEEKNNKSININDNECSNINKINELSDQIKRLKIFNAKLVLENTKIKSDYCNSNHIINKVTSESNSNINYLNENTIYNLSNSNIMDQHVDHKVNYKYYKNKNEYVDQENYNESENMNDMISFNSLN